MRERPSRHAVLMHMAEAQAERGTCSRAQVGVVIAREGRVLVTGYNGAPAGMLHCNHNPANFIDQLPAEAGCLTSVHAEANAVAYAARFGVALEGATLYTTYTPCLACAQIIINAGIRGVVALHAYRLTTGVDLIRQAGLSMDLYKDVR